MFGTNSVQSSWANPQQNQQQQQQQQQGSAFGQPGAFGSGAFGSTSAFGQPQQQQPANPMFGTTNTTTTPFGGFGQTTAQPTTTAASVFGAPKPATGFGAFGGGTSGFGGGTNAFGSTNTTATTGTGTGTGMFGSNTGTTGAFGAGAGMFGQNKPTTTGFGTAAATPGQDGTAAPVSTGTASPPYNAFNEKDPSTNTNLQYQTITALPAYRGTSLEELRLQDYQQGRKTAGAFGQTSFATPATQPVGMFGATTTQQPTTSSIFGGGTTGAFGTNTAQQPTSSAFGGFGQQNQPAAGTGSSLFGGTSTFGQPQQSQPQQPASAFGGFGQQNQQQNSSGGLFGGGAFGQNKPATGFGTGFGGTTGTTFGSTGTSNVFGQSTTQPTAGTTTGLFGQPQQQTQSSTAFGGFGTAAKPSIFGQPAQTTGTTGTGFGLFGNQQQQQPQQPQQSQQTQPATGLFGSTTPAAGGSLFGQQQQPQQQQQQTGGLFGNTTTQPSGGLFGSTTGTSSTLFGNTQQNQAQQPAQTGGLFGTAKPVTGTGLFGGGTTFGQTGATTTGTGTQSTSIFGQPLGQTTTTQPSMGTSSFGSSLFGQQKPAAPAINTSTSTGGLGTSLFGNTTSTLTTSAPPPSTLTASIAEPIAGNLPIFSMLPPGPRAVPIDSQPKKKPGFFVDVPTRSPVPRIQLGYTPANSRLRGFSATASSSTLGGQNGSSPLSLSLTNGKPGSLSLSRVDGQSTLGSSGGADAFLRSASPALGSGGRQSVKKLILDKKVEPADLFSRSGSSRGSPGRVSFNPALSQAAREKEVAREKEATSVPASSPQKNEGLAPSNHKTPNRFTAHTSTINLGQPLPSERGKEALNGAPPTPQHGDYWVKPELATLKNTSYEELLSFRDLVVGRIDYGEIRFIEPVDLTGLPKLGALLGELVRFDDKECSVYPDGDDADKPAPGSGLNVRARIALVRCWATDKATREPIKDEKDPRHVKHLKRLKSMKDTQFESFDIKEGKWTFTVDHF
ncbi:nucleoporin autopeptidase-domain-containing protein [Scleroderma citrinum]